MRSSSKFHAGVGPKHLRGTSAEYSAAPLGVTGFFEMARRIDPLAGTVEIPWYLAARSFRWAARPSKGLTSGGTQQGREFIYNDPGAGKDSGERQVCPISRGRQAEREFLGKLTRSSVVAAPPPLPFSFPSDPPPDGVLEPRRGHQQAALNPPSFRGRLCESLSRSPGIPRRANVNDQPFAWSKADYRYRRGRFEGV